ncbi:MAG: Mrp/NBP35 family ATP-binding protein [Deltaproteobacteria bacterium]|nr:MAG: Mrp/NBP35 family ATP-binding protein [Deltaproteobacteria bacterium]
MDKGKCDERKPCASCELASACSDKEKDGHEQERLQQKLFHIKHKIMVMSGKGGVGKSTVAVNLAAGLALQGYQVGILDADLHGPDVPRMLGLEGQYLTGRVDGVEPVEVFRGFKAVSMALLAHDPDKAIIWRGPLKHSAIKQFLGDVNWGDLDFLLIDLPPGTGDEPLSVARLIKDVDGAIIVTTPQDVALLDSRKAVNFSSLIEVPVLGIVENMGGMSCPHCGGIIDLFKVGGGEQAARELGVSFLGRIPIDPQVVVKCDSGEPLVTDPTESVAKTSFVKLVQGVLDRLASSSKEMARTNH